MFESFRGRSYSDNPRVISERLHERYPKAEIIWQFSKDKLEMGPPPGDGGPGGPGGPPPGGPPPM